MSTFQTVPEGKPIRVVQVGCGSMAQGWVDRAQKKQGIEIVGLVDIRREAAEKTATSHNLPPGVVYNSIHEALEQARPDAVIDITVPGAHFDVTMAALAAGCHVLGEKPLSDTLIHARKMCQAAKKAKRLYMVTQNRRYLGNIQAFSQAISAQTIGQLSSLDADFFLGAHFGGFRDEMENVLLLDMAIHTFDQARFISGCDAQAVYCHEYNPHGSWFKGNAAAICVFEMTNGVVFTYRGSWAAEGFNTSWECAWRAIGSNGTILWDGNTPPKAQRPLSTDAAFVRKVEDIAIPEIKIERGGHEGVLDDFVDCLRTGRIPQTECHDNIKSLAMCLAAVESARTKRRVAVKW